MLVGYRTYIMAAVGVIGAAASYLVGDITLPSAITAAATALSVAFLRKAV